MGIRRCLPQLTLLLLLTSAALQSAEDPVPLPVSDFEPPAAGEHPRLFFRRADLPGLRERAATEAGQAILARLRRLLDGDDGRDMPEVRREPDLPYGDKSKPVAMPLGAYTLSHVAGYGLLYQLTGEQVYADLGRTAFEWGLAGIRDRDGKARYSFRKPTGALRAGPSLGWYAVGYDLCYEGWDEDFRRQAARALQDYDEGENMSLSSLAQGARLHPTSNHWGPQVGGAALALLAIRGDPGVDAVRVEELLAINREAVATQLRKGWSPYGYFKEGDGAGCISSDTAFLPALQAWRVAGGQDYVRADSSARWMTLKWVMGTVPTSKGGVRFPSRHMYPHNVWARTGGAGGGLSGAGVFAQGFGTIEERYRPALLWLYDAYFADRDAEAGAPYGTASPYPHRCLLSLVNWPLDLEPQNPAEVLGHLSGFGGAYLFARNRWRDEHDVVVSILAGHRPDTKVLAGGRTVELAGPGGPTFAYAKRADDGSCIFTHMGSRFFMAVDFGGSSGADFMLAAMGAPAVEVKAPGVHADRGELRLRRVEAGGYRYLILTAATGEHPELAVDGDLVTCGDQSVTFDGTKLILGEMGAGPEVIDRTDDRRHTPADDQALHGR